MQCNKAVRCIWLHRINCKLERTSKKSSPSEKKEGKLPNSGNFHYQVLNVLHTEQDGTTWKWKENRVVIYSIREKGGW